MLLIYCSMMMLGFKRFGFEIILFLLSIFSTFIPSRTFLLVLFACVTAMLISVWSLREVQQLSLFAAASTTHVVPDVRNVVLRLCRKSGDQDYQQWAMNVKVGIYFPSYIPFSYHIYSYFKKGWMGKQSLA